MIKRQYIPAILLSILVVVLLCVAQGLADFTDGYSHNQDIECTNTGTATISQPLTIDSNHFDLSTLIAYGFIQTDAEDITIDYLGNEEYLTAVNLSGTPAMRMQWTTIQPDQTIKKTIWFGDASGTRNQTWIADAGDTTSIMRPGSLSFSGTEAFSIRCDITPSANPGTRQTILGIDDSWLLSLDPGPLYRWYCVGSGAPNATATLSATVDTRASLIAWHNGPGGQIALCNTTVGICDTATFSDLQIGGTLTGIANCDCVLDELSVRVPDFPASGTPPGGPGTPPAAVYYATFSETAMPGTSVCIYNYDANYPNISSINYDASEPALGAYTHRYGMFRQYCGDYYSTYLSFENGVSGTATQYWGDDQILSGISLSITIEYNCDYDHDFDLSIVDADDPLAYQYQFPAISVTADQNGAVVVYNTGTYQVTPRGNNWTIGKIADHNYTLQLHTTDSSCACSHSTCPSSANVDMWLHDFSIRWQVDD